MGLGEGAQHPASVQGLNEGIDGLPEPTSSHSTEREESLIPNKLVELIRQQAGIPLNYHVTQKINSALSAPRETQWRCCVSSCKRRGGHQQSPVTQLGFRLFPWDFKGGVEGRSRVWPGAQLYSSLGKESTAPTAWPNILLSNNSIWDCFLQH